VSSRCLLPEINYVPLHSSLDGIPIQYQYHHYLPHFFNKTVPHIFPGKYLQEPAFHPTMEVKAS
jgi:hypothetical protein